MMARDIPDILHVYAVGARVDLRHKLLEGMDLIF